MYKRMIHGCLMKLGYLGKYDPRHVEAYMRLGHDTLDGLSWDQFKTEVEIGMACIDADGLQNAESLAKSFGL